MHFDVFFRSKGLFVCMFVCVHMFLLISLYISGPSVWSVNVYVCFTMFISFAWLFDCLCQCFHACIFLCMLVHMYVSYYII